MNVKRRALPDGVIIRALYDLPYTVKAFVTPSPDGLLNAYYNANVPEDQVMDALEHEFTHVEENHFNGYNVDAMEKEARE